MKELIADLHTHTIASGHAYGTIREMARAAQKKGLLMIGFAEHAPGIPGSIDPFYYNNLQVVPKELYGVKIVHSSEINVLNGGKISLEQQYIDKLSYAVLGIHTQCYNDAGRKENTENIICGMKNEKVKIISHPDDDHTPLDYELLVSAAKENGVALELNNSSLVKEDKRLNCVKNYKKMLCLCMEMGVNIVVSSDAHDPSWVGEFTLAKKLLQEIDFDERLIINNDLDKIKEFIL